MPWSWQRPSTTARNRWRRREREWSARCTTRHGDRSLHSREPQALLGKHSGIGYELVLALDVPVLQMVEQPVGASALAFFEEEEAKALNAEYLMLARSATSHTVRLREVIQRMHVLRQKGRGRKKKKRRKRRTPRTSSRSSLCRARRRPRRWHAPGWFSSAFLLALCSSLSLAGPRCSASRLFWTRRTVTRFFLTVACARLGLQAHDARHHGRYGPDEHSCAVDTGSFMVKACDARHHGRFGPEVQLRRHWWHAWLVLLVTLHLALCFLPCLRARDAWHHGRYGSEGILRVDVQKTADFRSRFLTGRRFPVAVQRPIPMVLLFSRPYCFPSCSGTCGRRPCYAGRAASLVVCSSRTC